MRGLRGLLVKLYIYNIFYFILGCRGSIRTRVVQHPRVVHGRFFAARLLRRNCPTYARPRRILPGRRAGTGQEPAAGQEPGRNQAVNRAGAGQEPVAGQEANRAGTVQEPGSNRTAAPLRHRIGKRSHCRHFNIFCTFLAALKWLTSDTDPHVPRSVAIHVSRLASTSSWRVGGAATRAWAIPGLYEAGRGAVGSQNPTLFLFPSLHTHTPLQYYPV
jgi:hypothetical protein